MFARPKYRGSYMLPGSTKLGSNMVVKPNHLMSSMVVVVIVVVVIIIT
jgi:hypothetical protein